MHNKSWLDECKIPRVKWKNLYGESVFYRIDLVDYQLVQASTIDLAFIEA